MKHILHDLAYHIEIDGSGPPLLLLHGFTGSTQNWQALVPALGKTHTVIRVDLPGHGRTALPEDPARYAMPSVAQDLAQLLVDLQVASAQVWGYSMGARLALYLALDYPDRVNRLILESGSPGLATEDERALRRASDEALAQCIEQDGTAAFVREWESLPMWASQSQLPAAQRQRLHELRLQNSPLGLANSLRYMGAGAQPSLWPRLPMLQIPVALVAGTLDAKFVQIGHAMQLALPDATLHIIAGAGHAVHVERPQAVATLIR